MVTKSALLGFKLRYKVCPKVLGESFCSVLESRGEAVMSIISIGAGHQLQNSQLSSLLAHDVYCSDLHILEIFILTFLSVVPFEPCQLLVPSDL